MDWPGVYLILDLMIYVNLFSENLSSFLSKQVNITRLQMQESAEDTLRRNEQGKCNLDTTYFSSPDINILNICLHTQAYSNIIQY